MKTFSNVQISTFDGAQFATLYGIPFRSVSAVADGPTTITITVPDSVPSNPTLVFSHVYSQLEIINRILTSPLFVDVDWNAPVGSNSETAHSQIQTKATFDALTVAQKAEALRLEAVLSLTQRNALRTWLQKAVKYELSTLAQGD